jgi:hypothetical protein
MQHLQGTVMDRLMVRDAVAQHVQIPDRVVYVPPHSAALDAGKCLAEAGHPERPFVMAREQETPEPKGEFGHHPADGLGATLRGRATACGVNDA